MGFLFIVIAWGVTGNLLSAHSSASTSNSEVKSHALNSPNIQMTKAANSKGIVSSQSPTINPSPGVPPSKPAPTQAGASSASTIDPSDTLSSVFHQTSLYADPSSDVAVNARSWAVNNPIDADAMNRLASVPMASWYVGNEPDVQSATNTYVSAASAAGQMPVLVAYNIPDRDCGGYSSGGASSAAAYNSWISSFSAGIGDRQAIVILEPDALASMDCLSSSDQQIRLSLIANAVYVLKTDTKSLVYIDAGNAAWQSTSVIASRLTQANIFAADGFSLNVSNFFTTASNDTYGEQISGLLKGKHFVVDTSRNGSGPDSSDDWCNPSGRSFGQQPTLSTGNSLIDAYLWIKQPGESDGACGPTELGTSAPAPGTWWPQYALAMLQDSGW